MSLDLQALMYPERLRPQLLPFVFFSALLLISIVFAANRSTPGKKCTSSCSTHTLIHAQYNAIQPVFHVTGLADCAGKTRSGVFHLLHSQRNLARIDVCHQSSA